MLHNNFLGSDSIGIFGKITTTGTTIQNMHVLNAGAINYCGFAASAVQISCANAVDTALGTGTRSVLVAGLDADFNKQLEVIPTSGQSASIGTKVFSRVFSITSATVGTGIVNAGNIFASPSGTALASGVPTAALTYVMMLAGEGFSCNGLFTVPAGKFASIPLVQFSNTAQIAEVSIVTRQTCGLTQVLYARMPATSPIYEASSARNIPERTDIYMRVRAVTTGAIASGRMVVRT